MSNLRNTFYWCAQNNSCMKVISEFQKCNREGFIRPRKPKKMDKYKISDPS